MTYQLYRIDDVETAPESPPIGDYPDFEAALAARDGDVIAQLRDAPVPPREISHVIVGPGARGPRTRHALVTFAGTTVTDPDPAAEVAATADWLNAIRGG